MGVFLSMCCRFHLTSIQTLKLKIHYNYINPIVTMGSWGSFYPCATGFIQLSLRKSHEFIHSNRIECNISATSSYINLSYYITSLHYKVIIVYKTFVNNNHPHAKDRAINYILRIKISN